MNPNVADFILIIYKIRFNATFVKEYLQVRGGFKKKEGKFGSLAKTFLTPLPLQFGWLSLVVLMFNGPN